MSTAELLALKQRLEALSPADRLRAAAEFVDTQQYTLAEAVVVSVLDALRSRRAARQPVPPATPEGER